MNAPHQCHVGAHDWQWVSTVHTQGEAKRVDHSMCKRTGCTLQKTVTTVTTYHGALPEPLPADMLVERGTAEEGDRGYGR